MDSVRDIAKSLVHEIRGSGARDLIAANHYRRYAMIDYAAALRKAPHQSPQINEEAFETAYIYAERAIASGTSEERMDMDFYRLRLYWIPRLPKGPIPA